LTDPVEDTPRRVFADYLEENDEPDRAEFIRVDCDLGLLPFPNESNECEACGVITGSTHEPGCRRFQLLQRKQELWKIDAVRYMGQEESFWKSVGITPEWYHTDRGFLSIIDSTPVPFLGHADRVLWHPSQDRPCPLSAQPINLIRFRNHQEVFGANWYQGDPANGWVGAVVLLAWQGGERHASKRVSTPVVVRNTSTAAQQVWPWITFEMLPE
jgi:uncharacterized protein (TIGR02996 family)